MAVKARLIAFYLPQFHPIPENDAWWKGFTEWTEMLAKTRAPLGGTISPAFPRTLVTTTCGYQRSGKPRQNWPPTRAVEGVCYYHYWFAGKRLLERPFTEVVASGKPELPTSVFAGPTRHGRVYGMVIRVVPLWNRRILASKITGTISWLFGRPSLDERYLRVDGRPIFVIYRPNEHPDVTSLINQWRDWPFKAACLAYTLLPTYLPMNLGIFEREGLIVVLS